MSSDTYCLNLSQSGRPLSIGQMRGQINKFLVNRIKYFYLNKRTLRHCLLRSFGLSMRFAHNKIAKVVATRDWLAVDTKSVINWDCNCHR